MDSLTLAAIALAVLAVIVTVAVLRRSWGSPPDHLALPLAEDRSKPTVRYNSVAISDPNLAEICFGQTHAVHPLPAARRPQGLGWRYEAQHPEGTRWAGHGQHQSDQYKISVLGRNTLH